MTIEFKAPEVGPNADALTSLTRGRGPRRGNLEDLLDYWRPIMKKPGGFRRCVITLIDKPQFGGRPQRICAWLHHELTGKWPNEGNHHGGRGKRRKRKLTGSSRRRGRKDLSSATGIVEVSSFKMAVRESREFNGLLVQPIAGRQNVLELKAAMFRAHSTHLPIAGPIYEKRVGIFGSNTATGQAAQAAGSIILPGDISDFRSPIRSQIYETLTPGGGRSRGLPSARRLIRGTGRGARNKFRCPPGFEKGGTFTNAQFSTCGAQILGIPSTGPGSPSQGALRALARLAANAELVREIGDLRSNRSAYDIIRAAQIPVAPKKTSATLNQTSVDLILNRINTEEFSTRAVRRDGVILEPVVSLQALAKLDEFDDLADGSLISRYTTGQIGKDIVPTFSTGLRNVYVGIPEVGAVRISRVGGELSPDERSSLSRSFPTSISRAANLPDPTAAIRSFADQSNGRFEVEFGVIKNNKFTVEKAQNELIKVQTAGGKILTVPRWVYETFLSRSAPRRAKTESVWEIVSDSKSVPAFRVVQKSIDSAHFIHSSYYDSIEERTAFFKYMLDDSRVSGKALGRRIGGEAGDAAGAAGGRARAFFDPGINRYRCPPGTRYGGRITDQFGRNCGYSLPRNIVNNLVDMGMRVEDAMERRRRGRVDTRPGDGNVPTYGMNFTPSKEWSADFTGALTELDDTLGALSTVLDKTEDTRPGTLGRTIGEATQDRDLTPEESELLNGDKLRAALENLRDVLNKQDFDNADIDAISKAYKRVERAANMEAGRRTAKPARTPEDRQQEGGIANFIIDLLRRLLGLGMDNDSDGRVGRRDGEDDNAPNAGRPRVPGGGGGRPRVPAGERERPRVPAGENRSTPEDVDDVLDELQAEAEKFDLEAGGMTGNFVEQLDSEDIDRYIDVLDRADPDYLGDEGKEMLALLRRERELRALDELQRRAEDFDIRNGGRTGDFVNDLDDAELDRYIDILDKADPDFLGDEGKEMLDRLRGERDRRGPRDVTPDDGVDLGDDQIVPEVPPRVPDDGVNVGDDMVRPFGDESIPDDRSMRNVRNRFPRNGLPDEAYWRDENYTADDKAELERRFGRYYDDDNQLNRRGKFVNEGLRREREGNAPDADGRVPEDQRSTPEEVDGVLQELDERAADFDVRSGGMTGDFVNDLNDDELNRFIDVLERGDNADLGTPGQEMLDRLRAERDRRGIPVDEDVFDAIDDLQRRAESYDRRYGGRTGDFINDLNDAEVERYINVLDNADPELLGDEGRDLRDRLRAERDRRGIPAKAPMPDNEADDIFNEFQQRAEDFDVRAGGRTGDLVNDLDDNELDRYIDAFENMRDRNDPGFGQEERDILDRMVAERNLRKGAPAVPERNADNRVPENVNVGRRAVGGRRRRQAVPELDEITPEQRRNLAAQAQRDFDELARDLARKMGRGDDPNGFTENELRDWLRGLPNNDERRIAIRQYNDFLELNELNRRLEAAEGADDIDAALRDHVPRLAPNRRRSIVGARDAAPGDFDRVPGERPRQPDAPNVPASPDAPETPAAQVPTDVGSMIRRVNDMDAPDLEALDEDELVQMWARMDELVMARRLDRQPPDRGLVEAKQRLAVEMNRRRQVRDFQLDRALADRDNDAINRQLDDLMRLEAGVPEEFAQGLRDQIAVLEAEQARRRGVVSEASSAVDNAPGANSSVVKRVLTFDWRSYRQRKAEKRQKQINELAQQRYGNERPYEINVGGLTGNEGFRAMSDPQREAYLKKMFSDGVALDGGTVTVGGKTYRREVIPRVTVNSSSATGWSVSGRMNMKVYEVNPDGSERLLAESGFTSNWPHSGFSRTFDGTNPYHNTLGLQTHYDPATNRFIPGVGDKTQHVDFRGGGIASQINSNAMLFYRGAGYKKVGVSAAYDGPAAWPAQGFRDSSPDKIRRLNTQMGDFVTLGRGFRQAVAEGRVPTDKELQVGMILRAAETDNPADDPLERVEALVNAARAANNDADNMPAHFEYLQALLPSGEGQNPAFFDVLRGKMPGDGDDDRGEARRNDMISYLAQNNITITRDNLRPGGDGKFQVEMYERGKLDISDLDLPPRQPNAPSVPNVPEAPQNTVRRVDRVVIDRVNNMSERRLRTEETSDIRRLLDRLNNDINDRAAGPPSRQLVAARDKLQAELDRRNAPAAPAAPSAPAAPAAPAGGRGRQIGARVGAFIRRPVDSYNRFLGRGDRNSRAIVPDAVPVGNNGMNTKDDAVAYMARGGGGLLAEVPDEFLRDAIMGNVGPNERFTAIGTAGGINGMLRYRDNDTGQYIGIKFSEGWSNGVNEAYGEILGNALAERLGFPVGQIRMDGPATTNPPRTPRRTSSTPTIIVDLAQNIYNPGRGDMVPPTGGGDGSLGSRVRMTMLDMITGNSDRHSGNYFKMRRPGARNFDLYPIDFGLGGPAGLYSPDDFRGVNMGNMPNPNPLERMSRWRNSPLGGGRNRIVSEMAQKVRGNAQYREKVRREVEKAQQALRANHAALGGFGRDVETAINISGHAPTNRANFDVSMRYVTENYEWFINASVDDVMNLWFG